MNNPTTSAMDGEPPTLAVRPRYTPAEELTNCLTHAFGTVLAVLGLIWMLIAAATQGEVWHLVGVSVFGLSMIFMFGVSTLYHGVQNPETKQLMRLLDHSAIFVLIAGTYTPFTLVSLHGPWGWSMLALIWTLAVLGVGLELSPLRRWRVAMVTLYVVMGWSVVVAVEPLLEAVAPGGLLLLLLGGIAYTLGIAFYAWRRLRYHHAVWHLFVLAGSVLHFSAVLLYVIPTPIP